MDYFTSWLSHRYDSIYTCYDWYSITFHVLLVFIVSLGMIGAVRRRDRALIALLTGLLLLFIGDPIRQFGLMLFVPKPSPDQPFITSVLAQRPWELLREVDMNAVKPIGLVLAIVGALGLAGYGRGQRRIAPHNPQASVSEPDQPAI
jgi:hypothetical protein